jgi:ubiquinone/menaquinone biosynthesis C-methylase UbiE
MLTYQESFKVIEGQSGELKKTSIGTFHLIQELAMVNMVWEKYQFSFNDDRQPNMVANLIVHDAVIKLKGILNSLNSYGYEIHSVSSDQIMEEMHQSLFEHLWTEYDEEGYSTRIQDYVNRLEVNNLGTEFLHHKIVLDLGCGHGNFLQACLKLGAKQGIGIDFGNKSIDYAKKYSENLSNINFKVGNVYDLEFEDNSFDFVIQNGVFHHLEDEEKAYKEAYRVLKKGGKMWIYTDGGGIRGDLWDYSRKILSDVPFKVIRETLKNIGYTQAKCYHISDGLNAIYRHTTVNEIQERLTKIGFGEYKRLKGGEWFDLDGDFLKRKYANEIAGDGDIRILIEKIN